MRDRRGSQRAELVHVQALVWAASAVRFERMLAALHGADRDGVVRVRADGGHDVRGGTDRAA